MATRSLMRLSARWQPWWPWLVVGLAWLIVVAATLTGQRMLTDHHFLLEESNLPWPLAAAVFLVGWLVMIVAMMLPSSIVGISHIAAEMRNNARPYVRFLVLAIGYMGVWTAFGLFAFTGDTLLHRLVDAWPWLAAHSFLIGATTLGIAGLFQFTPWKRSCLAWCRALHEAHTDGTDGARSTSAWQQGVRHGATSIGCCWALMLVMFGIGVGGFAWMLGLTAIMFVETVVPGDTFTRRTRQAVGFAFLALAGLWLAHPVWLAPALVS